MLNDSICLSYGLLPPVKLIIDEKGIWKRRNSGRRQGTTWERIYRVDLIRGAKISTATVNILNKMLNSTHRIQTESSAFEWIHVYFIRENNKYRLEILPMDIRYGPDWNPIEAGYAGRILGTCAEIIRKHVKTELIHEYSLSKGYFISTICHFKAKRRLRWENQDPK